MVVPELKLILLFISVILIKTLIVVLLVESIISRIFEILLSHLVKATVVPEMVLQIRGSRITWINTLWQISEIPPLFVHLLQLPHVKIVHESSTVSQSASSIVEAFKG